ncbi:unnamed protein product, partial [Phaeothamnion confervicola]
MYETKRPRYLRVVCLICGAVAALSLFLRENDSPASEHDSMSLRRRTLDGARRTFRSLTLLGGYLDSHLEQLSDREESEPFEWLNLLEQTSRARTAEQRCNLVFIKT